MNSLATILGGTAIVLHSDEGVIQQVNHNVMLSWRKGHMYGIKNSSGETVYKITAEGFDYLNKFAGLKDVDIPTFNLNGEEITNPYIMLDRKGNKTKVVAKSAVIGRGPDGKIYSTSKVISYDLNDVFKADLINKIRFSQDKKDKERAGFFTTEDEFLANRTAGHAYYPIDDVVGVAVNLSCKDVMKAFSTVQDSKENIERKAQTIARRNAMRVHPAIGTYSLDIRKKVIDGIEDYVAYIPIVQWIEDGREFEEKEKEVIETPDTEVEVIEDIEEASENPIEEVEDVSSPVEDVEIVSDEESRLNNIVVFKKLYNATPKNIRSQIFSGTKEKIEALNNQELMLLITLLEEAQEVKNENN